MERIKSDVLSAEERENLLAKLWVDKKGKRDIPAPFALYVAIDHPRPNLAAITADTLNVLSADLIRAENWARTWGRVVVCVQPGCKAGCVLGAVNDSVNKRFVPVKTTAKLTVTDLKELIGVLPEGNLGVITVNLQPTTIEGFLISYIHMVDEFIWDLGRIKGESYGEMVRAVNEKGFTVRLGTEEEILLAKMSNRDNSVRLYGSGVNKDVPKVMGGIIFNQERIYE